MGAAPVISYNHGSKNVVLLRRIFKICVWFISISSVVITAFALISSPIIVEIFTPKGTDTYTLARTGFFLFSINYILPESIFCILNVYCVLRWKTSAIISFVRTFVLIVINILLLPSADRRQRDLAVRAGRGGDDTVSVDLLFLEEKGCYHYIKLKKQCKGHVPGRKIAQIVRSGAIFDILNQLGIKSYLFFSGTSAQRTVPPPKAKAVALPRNNDPDRSISSPGCAECCAQ